MPYNIKQDDLTALEVVYRELARSGRLKLPARAAREFIKNRDSKLADLLHALNDQKSRLQVPHKRLSPLLEGVPGYLELAKAQEFLSKARKEYDNHLRTVTDRLRAWRGDDPVTALYREVFGHGNVVEIPETRETLVKEWATRSANRTPPGYKDASKDDGGIGDYLIWKSILVLASQEKKDCVFVTGEEKADWFVRSNRDGVYARPELVDEYRRASGGKAIELISLADLLKAMQVENAVVEEVRSAEVAAASVASAREARQMESSVSQALRPEDLRRFSRSLFIDREASHIHHWNAFRDELQLAGYSSLDQVERDLTGGAQGAVAEEMRVHHSQYFTEVGIARNAIQAARPELSEFMGSIVPRGEGYDLDD